MCAICPNPKLVITGGLSTAICVWETGTSKEKAKSLTLKQVCFIFVLMQLVYSVCFLKLKFSSRLVCYTYLLFINDFFLIVMFYVHVSRLFWATQMQLHVWQRHQRTTSSWVDLGTVRASFGTWISCLLSPSWGAIGLPSQRSASTSLLWVNNNVDRITCVTSIVFKLHSVFLSAI